jgi:hypothetical protein
VHEEWCPASRLPYEELGGLGVQVGVVSLGSVVGDYLAILVEVKFGVGTSVRSLPGVPCVPAGRHVCGRSVVTVAVQAVGVEVLADKRSSS